MRPSVALVVLAGVLASGSGAAGAQSRDPYKLKPGAQGRACFNCHTEFEETLKKAAVHTPVKSGDCTNCHDPHASSHGKLLAEEPGEICVSCHSDILPENALSVHGAAIEGGCVQCHDPHAAANKGVLLEAGNALCATCHPDVADIATTVQFQHPPARGNCLGCHDPHASTKSDSLLVKPSTELCISCHKPDQAAFKRVHQGYPVERGRCVSCHDPHGSPQPGILWPHVHPPVANKACGQCHNEPGAAEPLATKRQGLDVCRTCHNDLVSETMIRNRIHWPVVDRRACLNCHNPHASAQSSLLLAPTKELCGTCHQDTMARQARSETQHPPNQEGECATCHEPHGSDRNFLRADTLLATCGACHDWQRHSTHPIGEGSVDPRNPNLGIDCESCHRTHGTPNKHFTHFGAKSELCVECHKDLRR